MKKIIIGILFAIVSATMFAQDYSDFLVTYEGDTVYCNITKVEGRYVYYDVVKEGELRNLIAHKKMLKNYYCSEKVVSPEITEDKSSLINYEKFKYGMFFGYSERLGKIPSDYSPIMVEYYKDLKTGFSFGLDFTYYKNKNNGFGIKASMHKSIIRPIAVAFEINDSTTINGYISDNISIPNIEVFYSFKTVSKHDKGCFFVNPGLGYQFFIDDMWYLEHFIIHGKSFCGGFDAGYDFKLSETTSLGIQFSFVAGYLSKAEFSQDGITSAFILEPDNYESLTRFDIGLTLRFM